MFRRILVPVDGSEASLAGVGHAIELAKDSGGRLKLIHVIGEASSIYAQAHGWDVARVLGTLKAAAADLLAGPLQRAKAAAVDAESAVIDDPDHQVWNAIVTEARNWKADLIVIGTHGRRGIRRLVMGSDAESVIRSSPVPVLTVRAQAEEPAPNS